MGSIEAPYRYAQQYQGEPRPVRVIVVGAGISGIAAVKLFKERLHDLPVSLTLYEKNHDVGGTWLENRYPGCSCDIPAHGYTYSWEGNPEWSSMYAGAEEIFDYYKQRAQAYGVFEHVQLNCRVRVATWNESQGRWHVEIENTKQNEVFIDQAEVLINAGGFLNSWRWPEIPGIENFQGQLVHSARWDREIEYAAKNVAVIGSGSSAIQIVPQLQEIVRHLTSFHRSPTWITPEFFSEFAPAGRVTRHSEEQRAAWNENPDEFLQYRKLIETSANGFFETQVKGSPAQHEMFQQFRQSMSSVLDKKTLSKTIIPEFAVGCRRMTPGHGYLKALVADNVTVTGDSIEAFTPTGLRTKTGHEYSFDVIVCATGFDTSFRPSFPVRGLAGKELRHEWEDEPRSYLSVAAPDMPNYFMTTGPNFTIANGTVLPCLEHTISYAFEVVRKIQTEGIKSVVPKQQAIDEFQEHKDALMEDLVWTSNCASWYKLGKVNGKVWGPWPGSALHFMQLMRQPRWEDFEITYLTSNRFSFLGNGKSRIESTGGDRAWYVSQPGAAPEQ